MSEDSKDCYYSEPLPGKGISIIIGGHLFFFGHAKIKSKPKDLRLAIITKEFVG